jgi:hypothetical protein
MKVVFLCCVFCVNPVLVSCTKTEVCYEDNIDYYGEDLANISYDQVPSERDCQDAKQIRTANFGPGVNLDTVMVQRFVIRKEPFKKEKLIIKPFQDLNFAQVSTVYTRV